MSSLQQDADEKCQGTGSQPAGPRRVIIDSDFGVDDALALLIALRRCVPADPGAPVLHAICTVFGNVSAHQACENAHTLLCLFGRSDLLKRVYCGATTPLVSSRAPLDGWPGHGKNGLGDAHFAVVPQTASTGFPSTDTPAATIMVQALRQGEVDIIALGPLTNLAAALRLDPSVASNVRLFCMGGSANGRGNSTVLSEFNFHSDPEAAREVLAALTPSLPPPPAAAPASATATPPGPRLVLTSWELTERNGLTRTELDKLLGGEDTSSSAGANRVSLFLRRILVPYRAIVDRPRPSPAPHPVTDGSPLATFVHKAQEHVSGWKDQPFVMCDAVAMALYFEPSMATEVQSVAAQVLVSTVTDTDTGPGAGIGAGPGAGIGAGPGAGIGAGPGAGTSSGASSEPPSKLRRVDAQAGPSEQDGCLAIDWYGMRGSAHNILLVQSLQRQRFVDMCMSVLDLEMSLDPQL